MASGGSSFIATPVALSAGHSSPGRAMKSAGMKKSSATELLDQIRQLEVEGQKLRHSNLINLGVSSFNGLETSSDPGQYTPVSRPVITPTSPATLSALMDISNEQKTISDLRTQLDAQRKETERLQQQLVGDFSSAQRSSGSMHSGLPSSPSKTGFSTLPSTELFSARRAHYDYSGPPSHLEKSLKDSQEQVADLRRRLQEANELSEQQKRQFRSNIEELKSKLQETEINRDAVLDLRQGHPYYIFGQKESSNQEMMLNKFQMSIQQLQEKVRGQEEALQEANRRLESTNREKYLIDTALNQIRLLLVDVERKRGKPYFESDPVSKQVPGMLVHTFERFVQEMNSDSDQKKSRISELENEVKSLKQNISQDKESLIKEQQEKEMGIFGVFRKITNMSAEHEKQMLALQERANNSRKQATHLQQQLAMIEGQQDQQLKLRDATIVELESKIRHLKEEHQEDRIKWQEKREVYERSQESYQTETLKLRSDRDDALKETATLQSKLEESQNALVRCKTELDLEKQKTVHVWEKETAMQSRQKELETKLEEKQKDTERLEKMLELIKNECNAQVSEKLMQRISTAERMERERHLDQISSLTSQLSSLTEKSNRVSLELDLARSEANNLKQQLRDTADKLDSTRIQFEAVEAEKKHVANMLSDKKADMERVTQERDYYNGLLEQRNQEIANLKGQKEKLTIQLEEKEKNLKVLGDQSSKIVDLVDNNTRSNEILREEKDRLMTMLNERTVALEELKTSRETMSKKMKIREKRIKELEGEKQKYEEEAALRQEEMMIVHQEKESLFSELKESRYEVSLLTEQKDAVKRELEKEIDSQAKEISKLQAKVKAADQEVRLAQRTLRTRDSADHQAVKVADKMQKEVTLKRNEIDSLKTKMRWYEDKLDSLSRERNSLEHDKDRLKTSLNKSLTHSQQLSAELELSQNKVMDLKSQISRLETALEKSLKRNKLRKAAEKLGKPQSTTKNAMCQAELEQYQQDVARLKLRHQLDLQEAIQRSLPNKAQEYESPALFSAAFPGQHHMTSALGSRPASGSSERRFPSKDFSTESLPTRDTDEYKYVGSELKHLVDQMKTLMSERKQKQAEKASHHRRSRSNQNGYNSSESLSDTEYHSDVELERSYLRSRSREKSDNKEYSGYSSLRENRSRSLSPHHAHRRSFSNDTSNLLRSGNDCYSTRNGRSEEIHPSGTRDSYSTGPHRYRLRCRRGIPLPPPTEANNTEDLCRRLEQKIESLTKMGGSLQKENKEMADLMKVQGKKIKKVKESSKKVKKVTR
ncbi:coiled-coil domain-containing protein 158-like isoform X6 [Crassostrea angulata]|uniref:coiled-coil domain-containing protein 158-like isoform X6 n=1 Tax=Magallana angulata TaxID=2784310 RepID=UPI0022B1B608|nr:coiled-coil domain-containing protein 158-like isoform X6 [Crassostrea angulata]